MGLDTKTYWLTDRQSQCNFDFDFDFGGVRARLRTGGCDPGKLAACWDCSRSGREGLRWQGPAPYIKDRPVLSSERAPPQKQDRNCQTVINIWSWAPDGARHQDLLIDWPSVAMWLWLWLREENIRGLNLAVVKLTTVQVTRQPLQQKICKIGMIGPVKPVLTDDLCVVQKQKFFNNMLYVWNVRLTKGQAYS
jgi:hypothetical protein